MTMTAATTQRLHATPVSFGARNWSIADADGAEAGRLELAWFGESGTYRFAGGSASVYRKGLFSGEYALELDGVEVVRATRPSFWRRRFEVRHGDAAYEFATHDWGYSYSLTRGSEYLGEVCRDGVFTRKATLKLKPPVRDELALFLLWLGLVMFRRSRRARRSG